MTDAEVSTRIPGDLVAVVGAAALGLGALVLGVLALISVGASAARPSAVALLPMASAYAAQADARLKGTPSPQDYASAQAATEHELALAPRSVDAHLRLAAIEVARDGGLTVKALNELHTSYVLSPIDPDLWRWRIAFGLNHWTELDDATRRSVRDEISVTAHNRDAQQVQDTIMSVQNPTGRFAGLMSYSFVATPARAPSR